VNPLPNQLITNLAELKEHYRDFTTEYMDGELIVGTVEEKNALIAKVESFVLEHGG